MISDVGTKELFYVCVWRSIPQCLDFSIPPAIYNNKRQTSCREITYVSSSAFITSASAGGELLASRSSHSACDLKASLNMAVKRELAGSSGNRNVDCSTRRQSFQSMRYRS